MCGKKRKERGDTENSERGTKDGIYERERERKETHKETDTRKAYDLLGRPKARA